MSAVLAVIVLLCVYGFVRLFHLTSRAVPPVLYYRKGKSPFIEELLARCPMLLEPYVPPLLWGKSGHLQTIIYAKLGRVQSPFPRGERFSVVMSDGATMTYDVFEPHRPHSSGVDVTVVVCPGIANSCEAKYVCTFVNYAQDCGYRVAVLNHLGALASVKLTSSRIYTYGGTDEFNTMVVGIQDKYPDTKLLAVGFSMGANIVVKYFGDEPSRQKGFLCGMSICQGYDVNEIEPLMMSWNHFRRGYLFFMTAHQKSLLRRHYDVLFSEEAKQKYGIFDAEKIFATTTLVGLDELYSRKRAGFDTLEEYYTCNSSSGVIDKIEMPMFILNAWDDPIVPPPVLETPKKYAESHDKSIFALTRHGGHLGYFEGGNILTPDPVTWLDRVVIQYSDAIVDQYVNGKMETVNL